MLAQAADQQGEDLERLLGIELYLPVESHRIRASVDEPWIVGAQYVEDREPFGVDESGQRVTLSLRSPPLVSTLMLVPAESFDEHGALIGGLTVHTEPQAAGYLGLWITESHIYDLHEPWTKGKPEIEVDVQHGTTRQTLACAEEDSVPEPYSFNQDSYNYNAPFLIATPSQLASAVDQNFVVAFYEDDDKRCVVVEGSDSIKVAIDVIAAAVTTYTGAMKEDYQKTFVGLKKLLTALKKAFGGDDDFIGVIVGPQLQIGDTPKAIQMGDKGAYESGWVRMRWGTDVAH